MPDNSKRGVERRLRKLVKAGWVVDADHSVGGSHRIVLRKQVIIYAIQFKNRTARENALLNAIEDAER